MTEGMIGGSLKKVLLFGGTTEGRLLAEYISGLDCGLLVCVATAYGRELLPPDLSVHTGRLDEEGIRKLIQRERPGLIIDATHPYAAEVTENIQTALRTWEGACLLRCRRETGGGEGRSQERAEGGKLEEADGIIYVPDVKAAVRWLSSRRGNILVTTGSKELAAYSHLDNYRSRLYVRVLPTVQALNACKELWIEGRHIIAAQGPFSVEMNRAQLREYNCSFLVTKDGGKAGGYGEKLQAARAAGAVAVVIERPRRETGISIEEIKKQVKEWTEQ